MGVENSDEQNEKGQTIFTTLKVKGLKTRISDFLLNCDWPPMLLILL